MPQRKSTWTDVLIVGSGAVGVAAGLEAHEAGAQVVVIEKEAHLGGAAAISGGGCSCVGTQLQREHGIADSPEPGPHVKQATARDSPARPTAGSQSRRERL